MTLKPFTLSAAVCLSLVTAGCASLDDFVQTVKDKASDAMPGYLAAMQKFSGDETFKIMITDNADKAVPIGDRLAVLSYMAHPRYFTTPDELSMFEAEYEYKLSKLGCQAEPVGGKGAKTGLFNLMSDTKGLHCLSKTGEPGDGYIIGLSPKTINEKTFWSAHIVHPKQEDLDAHTAGMTGMAWKGSMLYKNTWATIIRKGGTFYFLPADVYDIYRKQLDDEKKARAQEQRRRRQQEKKIQEKIDVLELL